MALPRRRRLPAPVTEALHLEAGERPLAWAIDRHDRWHVGTERALYLATDAGDADSASARDGSGRSGASSTGAPYRRIGWEEIERADWQRDSDRLAVVEVAEWGDSERRTEIEIAEPGQLLELLRERVTKSVVSSVYAPVRGRAGLSVVARRSPAGDGPIVWSYSLAPGLDLADPVVQTVAAATLRRAQRELAGL